ncbi:tyrosine-protein phosphatase non-receptor type 23 [Trichonephila inaurata madagascariensis]|uniref:Tyrosine-protein phosphatase non-receptor type 23 n=1 Tax=Trichonephila inaurata madagascariensis TaxID=2747483 RepID=A0A8X6X1H3_9ARAC|nr:tyrosine-protein phosphatase non-receptor type 23 [Trichonephila inaurata madagascariensis]
MEAVPRLPMICCDMKISPQNTEFGSTLKKYIRDHYHEDPESYTKEIKELETLRQNAIKAPMDFTGCSILKRYYSQLHKLQNRFPMTDDGPACVPFMWTDIYSGVAYNITDIEYEEACILYNIGALHSKLGTMDSRCNAEGMKIACTHFQCAAWAFQNLRDTYPQPKGSDMSHDLLTFFINIMLAQAQECILEKSMLDNRKSSITAKIAAQVVDYYKCALGIMVSGSPSTDTGSILDIVGSKIFKSWKKFIEFKMSYYTSISHLYMGNQAEENEKWGERVAWFQSAFDHLSEAFKIAKSIDREDLNEPLTFTMDVIGGKHSSSKKENEFVYHDKVPALSSLPDLKGASLVKGIPFSITDPDVSGPDIFARLVPMEAHETSSLYSEEKAKILRSMVSKIEGKNEELMAYLSSLQLESGSSFDENDKIPQELLEKCAAISVRPNFISDLEGLMKELISVSKDVDTALKSTFALLSDEEKKELQHQETFGKRVASMLTTELKKECSKYEEAHKKAIESNNTLETAVSIHINNLSKLLLPLEDLAAILPSAKSLKTPENQKAMDTFNHLVDKVEEMRKQRQYLEQQLRDSLMNDDITKNLVTMKKKEDLQQTFAEELKKHDEIITYLDQNLSAQDNILCALTEANAHYAETRKAVSEIKHQRQEMVNALINSFEAYDDLVSKAKKGLEFYQKLQTNVTRLLTRVRSVTKVQDEERSQIAEAELRKGTKMPRLPTMPPAQHVPKLKDYLPYMTKQGGTVSVTPGIFNSYPPQQPTPPAAQLPSEPIRQATLGGPSIDAFDRKLKPLPKENVRPEDGYDIPSMGVRPTPVGSEQPSVPAMCTTTMSSSQVGTFPVPSTQQWPQTPPVSAAVNSGYPASYMPYQYPTSMVNNSVASAPGAQASNVAYSHPQIPNSLPSQNYSPAIPSQNISSQPQIPSSLPSQSYCPAVSNPNAISQPQIPSSLPSQSYNPAISNQNVSPSLQYNAKPSYQPSVMAPQSTNVPRFGIAQNEVNAIPTSLHQPFVNTSIRPNVPVAGSASNTMTYPSGTSMGAYQYARDSIPQNAGYVPQSRFSAPQQIGSTPTSSVSSPSLPQTQMNPSMQGTVQMNPYATVPNYTTSSSVYVQKPLPAVNNYQPSQLSQYYQANTQPASVTASMDTRTTTFNSSIPYSSNPNAVPLSQASGVASQVTPTSAYNYCANAPSQFYGQYSPQTSVNPSIQANYSNTNNVHPSSASSSHPYPNNYGNAAFPNQNTYYSFVPQNVQSMPVVSSVGLPGSNTPVVTYAGTSMPMTNYAGTNISVKKVPTGFSPVQVVNQQPIVTNTSVAPQPSSGSFLNQNAVLSSPGTAFSAQQSSHPPTNIVSQYNYPANHTGYNTSSVPNMQYQASTQPITPPCQPLQPIPTQSVTPPPCQPLQPTPTNVPNLSELKSPSSNAEQSVKNEGSHINAIRDLITPPLETEPVNPVHSTEEETLPQVLQPKVIDLKSIVQPKEKEPVKDPLDDPSVRSKFVAEVEKYEKFVEGLVRKSLNGTTPLDQKWKEFIDTQDKESRKLSISVARCYPLKNRFPDVMPYDSNRVQLSSAKDDYINASYLKDICPGSPVFLITQAPLPATFRDFWLMIWEQQVETLVCLLPDSELKNHVYFPKERGSPSSSGAFEITLQSYKEKNGFIERMINITHIKNRTSRVVVHLQFTQWPASGIPQTPAPLLQFISDVLSYHKQQRNLMRPVAVHCSAGIGRSGCFSLITALVNEMNNGHGPRDVAVVGTIVSQQRKFLIQDKEQLKFCYDTVLYYAQDLLMKRGILTSRASFEDKLPVSGSTSSHVRHPSEDFILGSGGLAKLQSGMEKLGLVPNQQNQETENVPIEATVDGSTSSHNGSGDISAENSEPVESAPEPTEKVTSPESVPEPSKDNKSIVEKPLPSITSLLDPSNFTLDGTGSPAKRKITKDNFACSRGSLSTSSSDSADPLSQLDPLWSLKK